VRSVENNSKYRGEVLLSIMAGWKPSHRSLEVEAAELSDISERDNAARVTFSRQVTK
jgi:hypothetical protein